MIIIRILQDQTLDYSQMKAPDEQVLAQHVTQWSELPPIAAVDNLIVLLPGQHITMTSVKLPNMTASERLKAIPFALEERMASDPESVVIAAGNENTDGALIVAITEVDYFETIINAIREAKLAPNTMLPDYLALRWEPNTWSVLLHNEMALVRTDVQQGFSVDANNVFLFLSLLLEKNTEKQPEKLIVWKTNPTANLSGLEKLSAPVTVFTVSEKNTIDPHLFLEKPAINLLQGKYRMKRVVRSQLKRNWMICGGVTATLIAFLFISNIIEWFYYHHQANALQTRVLQAYQVIFPGTTYLAEPRASTESLLKKMNSASANTLFLKLMNVMGKSVLQIPAITVQSIQFENHILKFTVQSPNLQVLSQWAHTLRSQAVSVRQNVLKTDQVAVQAEMIITENKS